ncbi:hypothetical protein MRX96_012436 [Rhipicephalus microplus]
MHSGTADRLRIGNEVRELKLGRSFSSSSGSAFHSIRYDFKPASVDTSKSANVEVGEKNQITVTVPHIENHLSQGSGTAHTVFKGSQRPYQRECVLVVDNVTGEVTLERLSCNIQLKKTRAEGSSKIQPRPITPHRQRQQRWRRRITQAFSVAEAFPSSATDEWQAQLVLELPQWATSITVTIAAAL